MAEEKKAAEKTDDVLVTWTDDAGNKHRGSRDGSAYRKHLADKTAKEQAAKAEAAAADAVAAAETAADSKAADETKPAAQEPDTSETKSDDAKSEATADDTPDTPAAKPGPRRR